MIQPVGNESDGFSLIELLVVVAVVSVLAIGTALVLPIRDDTSRTVAAFQSIAREARLTAMLSGETYRITSDGRDALLQRVSSTGWTETAGDQSGTAPLLFHPDGTITGGPVQLARRLSCGPDASGQVICLGT